MAIGANIGVKVIRIAVGIPVGIASRKLIARTWAATHPADPPRKPGEPDVRWGDAVTWAVLSGAGVTLAQLVTQSGSRSAYRAITGNEPPPQLTKEQKKLLKAEKKARKKDEAQQAKARGKGRAKRRGR